MFVCKRIGSCNLPKKTLSILLFVTASAVNFHSKAFALPVICLIIFKKLAHRFPSSMVHRNVNANSLHWFSFYTCQSTEKLTRFHHFSYGTYHIQKWFPLQPLVSTWDNIQQAHLCPLLVCFLPLFLMHFMLFLLSTNLIIFI